MPNDNILLPLEIYTRHLKIINGVGFTPREIDIIACILNGRSAKTMPSFLSISPKTVATHMGNIRGKAGCSSRESIIDFIENSDKLSLIKNEYYSRLLTQISFEKILEKFSEVKASQLPVCLLVYEQKKKDKSIFIQYIEAHLKLLNIKLESKALAEKTLLDHLIDEIKVEQIDHILVVVPEELTMSELLMLPALMDESFKNLKKVIFLFFNKQITADDFKGLQNIKYVDFSEQENYYVFFFELLKNLLPQTDLKGIFESFKSQSERIPTSTLLPISQSVPNISEATEEADHSHFKRKYNFQWKKRPFISALFFIGVCILGFFTFKGNESTHLVQNQERLKNLPIRSDLIIPMESSFLNRSELIAQIDNTFKGNEGIQGTALVGIGGAGKTTLARQYAHQQKANVIWEINAETQESLKASFEGLAQEVSKTEEEQKILRGLLDIKNPDEKEKKILAFVKEHLKVSPSWFLIFDNVEKFTNIQNYFPQDSSIWGRGKLLLTTRDRNIQNNSRVNHVVPIEELTQKQKLDLFTKIMNHGTNHPLTNTHHAEAKKFLENLPPFPLDVSVAAYYLKSTGISYGDYLENLKDYDSEFSSVQENLLKEAGAYLKTRYGVITLSLEHLIKSHKDFGELLVFVSLLDSQNIPKDLLDKHKNKTLVDNFIYHLKKYSLITADASHLSSDSTFSIHRSTQAITLSYLTKKLDLLKNNKTLQEICDTFVKYSVDAMDKGDFLKQKYLLNHCMALLSHKNLLTDFMKTSISAELGGLYCHQGFYVQAKEILEKIFQNIDKKYPILYAHVSIYLGKIYSSNGNYEKAKNLFENNLSIYKKYKENNLDLPKTLTRLGILYRKTGDYKKAKISLERALNFFKAHLPENHASVLWASINLGSIYLDQGEFEKAKALLEKNLRAYKQYFPENHAAASEILQRLGVIYRDLGYYEKAIKLFQLSLNAQFCLKNYNQALSESHFHMAGPLADLASVYIELNNHEKAKKLLEKSLNIYRKHVSENHVYAALALRYLGNAYAGLKDYQTAKDYLQKNLKIYTAQYGETHLKTAYVLRDLGRVHLLENHIEVAEKFLEKALRIFQKHKHPESYTCLESIAELSYIQSRFTGHKDKIDQADSFNTQTKDYLKQALDVVKTHFPLDSPHTIRIQSKIKKLAE